MEMRTEGPVKTRREGAILEVTLDAPKANAISLKTSRVMGLVFRDFRDDDSLRVCIIRAAGEKFFCPGWAGPWKRACSSSGSSATATRC